MFGLPLAVLSSHSLINRTATPAIKAQHRPSGIGIAACYLHFSRVWFSLTSRKKLSYLITRNRLSVACRLAALRGRLPCLADRLPQILSRLVATAYGRRESRKVVRLPRLSHPHVIIKSSSRPLGFRKGSESSHRRACSGVRPHGGHKTDGVLAPPGAGRRFTIPYSYS